jgi:hypothetical protein
MAVNREQVLIAEFATCRKKDQFRRKMDRPMYRRILTPVYFKHTSLFVFFREATTVETAKEFYPSAKWFEVPDHITIGSEHRMNFFKSKGCKKASTGVEERQRSVPVWKHRRYIERA